MALSKVNPNFLNVSQFGGSRNIVHNGAMQVDQRHNGSSFTVVNGNTVTGYIADRFRINENSSSAMTAQTVSDAPAGFAHSIKLTVTTADASLGSTEFHRIIQGIEGKDIAHLNFGSANAKTLTLSFHVKSSVTGQYYFSMFNGAANRGQLKSYTISSANTWEKKTITIIGDQTGTWLTTNAAGIYLMWSLGTGSSYQSNTLDAYQAGFFMAKSDQVNLAATNGSTWQLTGVQLEIGDTATPFEHEDIGTTLRKCQRYYIRWQSSSANNWPRFFQPSYVDNGYVSGTFSFPVQMRATPSTAATGTWQGQGADGLGTGSVSQDGITLFAQSVGASSIAGYYADGGSLDMASEL